MTNLTNIPAESRPAIDKKKLRQIPNVMRGRVNIARRSRSSLLLMLSGKPLFTNGSSASVFTRASVRCKGAGGRLTERARVCGSVSGEGSARAVHWWATAAWTRAESHVRLRGSATRARAGERGWTARRRRLRRRSAHVAAGINQSMRAARARHIHVARTADGRAP